jgi:hypothetical protein
LPPISPDNRRAPVVAFDQTVSKPFSPATILVGPKSK